MEKANEKAYRLHLMVCAGTACVSNNSFGIKDALEKEINKQGLEDEVLVVTTGCNGFCERGPLLVVQPGNVFYQQLEEKDIPHLVEEHFLKGRPVKKLMYKPPKEKSPIPILSDINFFKKQVLIALRNRGLIDPEKIDEYIARDGYSALAKALTEMEPKQIINEVKDSGLRGRGGGGFPTGLKWEFVSKSSTNGQERYIVCNGDEGDPGAFMDRSILEADPHAVIEGMIIGAKAIGASKGFVYVRNEYPLAVSRLIKALEQARGYGLLGKDILGSGFDFDIKIVRGAGAFVCGEETALMASIEGRLGEPRPRPPYPAEKGLWDNPTCINNVETWANVPVIINRSADWYSNIGTKTSKGTKVFSLVGKINNTGLVEVPMGITLREIIEDIGGGIPDGKKFKAVQTGGPSGGCIPAKNIDLPIDYESLTEVGSMMGSGGMVVMDEDTCMVDVAKYFISFTQNESCGKCTPCREGTKAMYEILDRITKGEGKEEDIDLLEDLAKSIKDSALCGLGNTAPNPVLTTLKYFKDEYEIHIKEKKCPAHVCRELNTYTIDEKTCLDVGHGCDLCRKNCSANAISGETKTAHQVIQEKCIKCGVCYDVCRFDAVKVK
ncbi:MAG: NADH-quinone oxidoreductase subunit NuoF [Candidatus Aminicenantes bacterium]|nr:NADH-quinone oxidoreductase subunit NuoF [Candidatus Aminicenantes bacterium]